MDPDYWDIYSISVFKGQVHDLRNWIKVLWSDYKVFQDLTDEEFLQMFLRRQIIEARVMFSRKMLDLGARPQGSSPVQLELSWLD